MSALENVHYGFGHKKMAVPSNSALFEGIGGDFVYSILSFFLEIQNLGNHIHFEAKAFTHNDVTDALTLKS